MSRGSARRLSRPCRHSGLHHHRAPRLRDRGPLSATWCVRRARRAARHVAAEEAAPHADAIFLGPGEQTLPRFLDDFRRGEPSTRYVSNSDRTLDGSRRSGATLSIATCISFQTRLWSPADARSIAISATRMRSFRVADRFTPAVDDALAEIGRLPGRHLYFSTITCSAIGASPRHCSMACAVWAGYSRERHCDRSPR